MTIPPTRDCAHPDNWFDRSLCAPPCQSMHTRCADCSIALDDCPNGDGTMISPADTLTVQQLDHLAGLLAAALSPTPWQQDGEWVQSATWGTVTHVNRGEPDAELIAAAVTALPALLATVRRQQAALDAVRAAVDERWPADQDEQIHPALRNATHRAAMLRTLASPAPTEAAT